MSVFERTFARCMGIGLDPKSQSLWVANLYQLWRFENALKPGQSHQGFDRVYVPQVGYTTGDVDAHDVAIDNEGVLFVNTLFSCLARPSDIHSFEPIWQPPHISKLAAEDRCHLNGLATKDGQAAYVTCVSQTDVNEGWREHRQAGGVVIDVQNNDVVADGLSMPHSPRWYKDGMSFVGDYAVVGLSKPRGNKTFEGLKLHEKLESKKVQPRCGLQVINLNTGDVVHELRIEGVVEELYDVCVLPGTIRPMAIGFMNEEIRRVLSLPF